MKNLGALEKNVRKHQLIDLTERVAQISGVEKPIICGTQSVFAYTSFVPDTVSRSVECDFLLMNLDPSARRNVLEHLGIDSDFREQEGYYADPVGAFTVVLPPEWQERLRPLQDENGQTVTYCTEIYDTAASKLIAGREKDFVFLRELLQRGLIEVERFVARVVTVKDMPQAVVLPDRIKGLLTAMRKERSSIDLRPLQQLGQELERYLKKPDSPDKSGPVR